MRKIMIACMALFTLYGCSPTGKMIEEVTEASEKTRELDNGTYTNWSKQTALEGASETTISGVFNKKAESYDWYTKLTMTSEGEEISELVTEILQKEGVTKQRFMFSAGNEDAEWQDTPDVQPESPLNLFIKDETLPEAKYVETARETEDGGLMRYTFTMKDSYGDKIREDAVAEANLSLDEARENDELIETIPALEQNVMRHEAISYANVVHIFVVNEDGILTSYESGMDVHLEDGTPVRTKNGTSIDAYNLTDIEAAFPTP